MTGTYGGPENVMPVPSIAKLHNCPTKKVL
jgi:hypothetical protein